MITAAIYARFSSDLQDDRSIDDQVAACRGYAERHGYEIVAVYEDRAISGATFMARAGLQRMLEDLPRAPFAAVIAESLSRLSRDQADTHVIGKELEHHDVKLVTIADGEVSAIIRGMRGIINEQQLADLRLMTRRGMAGRIAEGKSAGGIQYGYDAVAGQPGARTINQAQAEVVRRVYADFLAGKTPREIERRLNAEGIAPPRGTVWRANTLIGNGRRGNGILQNELYAGVLVWNRVRMLRHPRTRRRISRPNPESEWKRTAVPALAIIDEATWKAAQDRRAERKKMRPRDVVPAKRILSGLIRCGCCGAGMPSVGSDRAGLRIQCSGVKESGTCDNARRYYLAPIERAVIGGLKAQLGTRAAIALYIETFEDEWRTLAKRNAGDRPRLESRLRAAQAEVDRAVDLVMRGILTEQEAARRLPALRVERDRLTAEIAALDRTAPMAACPATVAGYLAEIERLDEIVNARVAEGHADVATTLRKMIDGVRVMPAPAGERPTIEVSGDLGALLAHQSGRTMAPVSVGAVVAGERFVRPHRQKLLPFSFQVAA